MPAPGHAPRILCVAATGYDNIDIAACRARRIAVANVRGYSTDSVAQVTVGLVLALVSHLPTYCAAVSDGTYSHSGQANLLTPPYRELAGMTWGVLGAGQIGSRVAGVARAFGRHVLTCRRHPDGSSVSSETLLRESDIVTIHTPLTEETRGMIGKDQLALPGPVPFLSTWRAEPSRTRRRLRRRSLQDGLAALALTCTARNRSGRSIPSLPCSVCRRSA